MPAALSLEPVVHASRGSALGAIAHSPWAPVVALASKLGIDTAALRFLPSGFADGRLRFSIAALSVGGASRRFSVALDGTAAEVDVRARLTLKGDLASPMTDADVAMAKVYATEVLGRVTDATVQIFGGMGLMNELPVERWWRDARVERIWDGTSEIQRHIIARSLLRPLGA